MILNALSRLNVIICHLDNEREGALTRGLASFELHPKCLHSNTAKEIEAAPLSLSAVSTLKTCSTQECSLDAHQSEPNILIQSSVSQSEMVTIEQFEKGGTRIAF